MTVIKIYIRLKKIVLIVYPNNGFWLFIWKLKKKSGRQLIKKQSPNCLPDCLPK